MRGGGIVSIEMWLCQRGHVCPVSTIELDHLRVTPRCQEVVDGRLCWARLERKLDEEILDEST
jgi:hypothetical protein